MLENINIKNLKLGEIMDLMV